ncbi:unnamed protein product, partial [Rotaria magnacalcarata]
MASSSSSSNFTPTNNKLQNSYFFYGTHPLKVPNALVHSNSTTSLSTSITSPNSNDLSLNCPASNHNNFRHSYSSTTDLATTKSLNNLANPRKDDDDNNE